MQISAFSFWINFYQTESAITALDNFLSFNQNIMSKFRPDNYRKWLSYIYIYIYINTYESSSSSSSCTAISMDIPDPLSPPLSIVHCSRHFFRATSRIGTGLLYAGSCWSSYLCSSMWRGPQEYIAYELVPISPAVSPISCYPKINRLICSQFWVIIAALQSLHLWIKLYLYNLWLKKAWDFQASDTHLNILTFLINHLDK